MHIFTFFFLITVVNSKNRSRGIYKYIKVTGPYSVILSECDGVVIQLVGVNSSKSSKDFASVVCYVSLGLAPCLGTGFEIRTKHPNCLLKGSY